jgi:hypothetical protein
MVDRNKAAARLSCVSAGGLSFPALSPRLDHILMEECTPFWFDLS